MILANRVVEVALQCGIPRQFIDTTDESYLLVDEDYVTGPFARWFATTLSKLGVRYKNNALDCENFGELARALMMLRHGLQNDTEDGLAIGWIEYVTEDWYKHNEFCAITRQRPDVVSVFETQLKMKPTSLTPDRFKLCKAFRM